MKVTNNLILLIPLVIPSINAFSMDMSMSMSNNGQSKTTNIQVCQNVHCKHNYPSKYAGGLPQTFADLIPAGFESVEIHIAGCLDHCESGPNVRINDKLVFNEITGIETAVAVLEIGAGIECPAHLMFAVEDMAMANIETNPMKKMEMLNVVIDSLQKADQSQSTAMAHALVLRSDARLHMAPNDVDAQLEAYEDALLATEINHLNGRAWRAIVATKEAMGDMLGAMEALTMWAEKDPSFDPFAVQKKATNGLSM